MIKKIMCIAALISTISYCSINQNNIRGDKNNFTYVYAEDSSEDSVFKTKVITNEDKTKYIVITALNKQQELVEIPASIDGIKVVGISDNAFAGNNVIKEVKIAEGVSCIGYGAFAKCSKLEKVSIPKSVTTVSAASFLKTPWLSSKTEKYVTVGNGVLIRYNGDDESPVIPTEVITIGKEAFAENQKIKKLVIPDNIINIDDYAFAGCKNLSDVHLDSSVQNIGEFAFWNCGMTGVSVPRNIKKIGNLAFGFYRDSSGYSGSVWEYKITGYVNTEAEKYAQENKITFNKYSDECDINGDCSVDVKDACTMKKYLICGTSLQSVILDTNNNKRVDVFDLNRIMSKIINTDKETII